MRVQAGQTDRGWAEALEMAKTHPVKEEMPKGKKNRLNQRQEGGVR